MAAAESPRRGHGSAEAAALQGGAAASVLASALAMAPATACELCGLDLGGDHSDCRALEARLDADAKRRDEALIAEFKLRRITSENCAGFDAAVRTVARAVGDEVAVDASRAFEAEGWWFVPYGWIGCAGHLVEKASGEVRQVGFGLPAVAVLLGPGTWRAEQSVHPRRRPGPGFVASSCVDRGVRQSLSLQPNTHSRPGY